MAYAEDLKNNDDVDFWILYDLNPGEVSGRTGYMFYELKVTLGFRFFFLTLFSGTLLE
jgi:hypothetical protein